MVDGYEGVAKRVASAAASHGRDEPELIAVSKTQGLERIRPVLKQGHRVFGENRVQEAAQKWPTLRQEFDDVTLHLLGPLQSNKLRQAFALFDVIHSLDRLKLARRMADLAQETGGCPELFIQINIGEEPQKAGIPAEQLPNFLTEIAPLNLPIIGLMCIPPQDREPRPYFIKLRDLAERHGLVGLSMGMSGDFEIAIEEGATHIRVGTAIFGERANSPNPE